MNSPDTQLIDQPRSRRGVLGFLAAGGGAVLATLLGRPERAVAADGDPVILGAANSASSKTALVGNVDQVRTDSPDPDAGALAASGSGLVPVINATSDAVADPDTGAPVAISGESTGGGTGVEGTGEIGVNGQSSGGFGVQGVSETGIAGHFHSFEGIGIGVTGRAAFSTVGQGTIPAGQNSVFVENPAVTDTSHVSVTS